MNHAAYMNESCHAHESIIKSCHTHASVVSRTSRNATFINVPLYMNESNQSLMFSCAKEEKTKM